MHIEEFRDFCLGLPGATEETPFGPDTLVFKVGGKLFALTDLRTFASINLKCDPEHAIDLRERYDYVQPGFHMNKKHWNTVTDDGEVPEREIVSMIDHSYDQVVAKLTRKDRTALGEMEQMDAGARVGTGFR